MPLLSHLDSVSKLPSISFVAPGALTAEEPQEKRRGTLLIVDDEEGPRQSLRVVFKGEYDLLIAKDGETAIGFARQNKIDVALLDIRMVGMSGIELLERLKQVDPAIEVIMLTAYETIDTIRQALRLGACDYLTKPFDIATMRSVVTGAMERRTFSSEVRSNSQKLQELQDELQKRKLEQAIDEERKQLHDAFIHEINGPLTIISAQIQSLEFKIGHAAKIEGDDLDLLRDRLKRITRQVSLCIDIARRYLSPNRQTPVDSQRPWINQVLADLGELLRVHPAAKSSQLVVVPLLEDTNIPMNSTDLMQLLLNLVINAFQSTPQQHRVEVRAELLSQALRLDDFQDGVQDLFVNRESFENTAPLLSISVQDTGPGIQPDVLPRIFEPYFTNGKRGQGQAKGLGLTIVSRFVRQAHGAIHVHSKVGQGTIFTVYLPLRESSSTMELKV